MGSSYYICGHEQVGAYLIKPNILRYYKYNIIQVTLILLGAHLIQFQGLSTQVAHWELQANNSC